MKSLSMWHWLIVALVVVLIFGTRRLGSVPAAFKLLYSAQPANSRREAEYVDDAKNRNHSQWRWLCALAIIFALGLLFLHLS